MVDDLRESLGCIEQVLRCRAEELERQHRDPPFANRGERGELRVRSQVVGGGAVRARGRRRDDEEVGREREDRLVIDRWIAFEADLARGVREPRELEDHVARRVDAAMSPLRRGCCSRAREEIASAVRRVRRDALRARSPRSPRAGAPRGSCRASGSSAGCHPSCSAVGDRAPARACGAASRWCSGSTRTAPARGPVRARAPPLRRRLRARGACSIRRSPLARTITLAVLGRSDVRSGGTRSTRKSTALANAGVDPRGCVIGNRTPKSSGAHGVESSRRRPMARTVWSAARADDGDQDGTAASDQAEHEQSARDTAGANRSHERDHRGARICSAEPRAGARAEAGAGAEPTRARQARANITGTQMDRR